MQNLDDMYYFARVVEHGGFSAAGRALGIPKSRLSRRINALEERLEIKLINRSTRQFSVTELGHAYYRHCMELTAAAEAAQAIVHQSQTEPKGGIRIACPTALLNFLVTGMLARYMKRYPNVEIYLESTNRQVDILREGFDLALRIDVPPLPDSGLASKRLSPCTYQLVASPQLLEKYGAIGDPAALDRYPSLSVTTAYQSHEWQLHGPDDAERRIRHSPNLVTDDMITLRRAALEGRGVVQLPTFVVYKDLKRGKLCTVLPAWQPKPAEVNALFPSRRGLMPAIRSLLDALTEEFAHIDVAALYARYQQSGDGDACILMDES
ncbi:LysR family transcriptional regulator [Serratia rubidaea]|uniref:LysR substrate-binding domain-containing protein n=1 Tax=Serratia rubidaea TaxID=61652 RepID=UPI001F1AFADD|nr:LysR substrate-binding domain-containing protein [Serratia rubidaea]UJD80354.1 LysR family transcriptional regulator [Serratia rubidaea]UJD84910.1 LysR family transcriptional regulator [Serratia rubidaea]